MALVIGRTHLYLIASYPNPFHSFAQEIEVRIELFDEVVRIRYVAFDGEDLRFVRVNGAM